MKKTGYRIISVLGILLAIGGIAWGVLSFTRMDIKFNKVFIGEFKGEATNVPVKSCSEFTVSGIWDISFVQGPPSLKIYASPENVAKLAISNPEDSLTLSTGDGKFNFGKGIRAELSMPKLSKISSQGGAHIDINQLNTNSFDIKSEGASQISIRNSSINDLTLSCQGASSVEAGSSLIVNATVDFQGGTNAVLGMNGGILTGNIQGGGHLQYSGSVSSETIKTAGLVKIERK